MTDMLFKDTYGTMEVGVAHVDITPNGPIRLCGFAAREKSETSTVMHKLSARALAFGSDKQGPSIFITVELLGIQWHITKKIVERLSKETGINPAQIAVSASHTHGGPETGILMNHLQCRGDYPTEFHFSDALLELDHLIHIAEYNEWLSGRLIEVAIAALKNRQPSIVDWGVGQASFAVNRRTEGGPVDHSMPILRVRNLDGTLSAILVNYACHGISLGPEINQIHGDWMGEAQRMIEARHPEAIALVSIGCAGDLHPVHQGKMVFLKFCAQEIADHVEELLTAKLNPLNSPPLGHMKWIKLPFSKIPTVPELIEITKDTTIKGYYARLLLERIQRGDSIPSELTYPIQLWNFGDELVMINMGGEVVVDYAIRLKQEHKTKHLWINAYSNDVSCYIASRRVIKEGGYEGDMSMYWYNQPSPLDEEAEEIIANTIGELMSASFKNI